jgi:hypothetical protein
MSIKDHCPVAKLCTKLIIKDRICNDWLMQVIEDRQLVYDVQKGFRRNRRAKRQVAKIHGILADQRQRRGPRGRLSVMLCLDIKIAFSALNYRAICLVMEAYDFPAKDIDLIRRMYSKSFFTVLHWRAGCMDSITLNGTSFTQLPPDAAHKHLGVRMTMTGCFQAEKKKKI